MSSASSSPLAGFYLRTAVRSGQVLGANRLCKPSTSVHLPPDNLVVGSPEHCYGTSVKNVYRDRILVKTLKDFMPLGAL